MSPKKKFSSKCWSVLYGTLTSDFSKGQGHPSVTPTSLKQTKKLANIRPLWYFSPMDMRFGDFLKQIWEFETRLGGWILGVEDFFSWFIPGAFFHMPFSHLFGGHKEMTQLAKEWKLNFFKISFLYKPEASSTISSHVFDWFNKVCHDSDLCMNLEGWEDVHHPSSFSYFFEYTPGVQHNLWKNDAWKSTFLLGRKIIRGELLKLPRSIILI